MENINEENKYVKPITLNLIGCCIIRDLFRIADKNQKYKIVKFIQSVSPFSFCDEKQNVTRITPDELFCFDDWSNFSKRNFCIDACKTVFSLIQEAPTDYIIIDLCELRFRHCKITLASGDTFYMTKNKYTTEFLKNDTAVGNFKVASHEDDLIVSDDEIYASLDKYIKFIKSCYSPEKVILIENLPARVHIDENNKTFFEYSASATASIRNSLLKYYDYFKNNFNGINVIEFPVNALGNINHTWGKDPLHFVDDYYEYLFQAVQIIVSNSSNENIALAALKASYEKYFASLQREKRMEYYICRNCQQNILIHNGKIEVQEGNLITPWHLSCSDGSSYDIISKVLACGSKLDNCWAMLSQDIPAEQLYGKEVTLSVHFRSEDASYVNLALYYKTTGSVHKHVYVYSKRFYSYGLDIILHDTIKFPESITDVPQYIIFAVYANEKNSKVHLHEVKLELGGESTLF